MWLVGNGNLGKKWDDYSDAEQDALLGLGAQLGAPFQVDPLVVLRAELGELRGRLTTTDRELAPLKGRRLVAETTIREVLPATS